MYQGTFGHKPAAGLSHYAASKAALEHLTRCWVLECASYGIRVNAVAAGPTESGALTGMMGLSPEVAEVIKEQERQPIPQYFEDVGRRDDLLIFLAYFSAFYGSLWMFLEGGLVPAKRRLIRQLSVCICDDFPPSESRVPPNLSHQIVAVYGYHWTAETSCRLTTRE
jgi:hypothetical protein